MRKRSSKRKMIAGLLALVMVVSAAIGNITLNSLANAEFTTLELKNEQGQQLLLEGKNIAVQVPAAEYQEFVAANGAPVARAIAVGDDLSSIHQKAVNEAYKVYFTLPGDDGVDQEVYPVSFFKVLVTCTNGAYTGDAAVYSYDAVDSVIQVADAEIGTAQESDVLNTVQFTLNRYDVSTGEGEVVNTYKPFVLGLNTPAEPEPAQATALLDNLEPLAEAQAIDELTTVATIDSKSKGVTIQMFDFNGDTFKQYFGDRGEYTYNGITGNVKYGLVQNKLSANGLPVATNRAKTELKDFGTGSSAYKGEANNLFLASKYTDGTKLFYYNAFENYAYWDQSTKNFKVYNQLGTPSNSTNFYFRRGNFFPFNDLSANSKSTNKNEYDEHGNRLASGVGREGENLYLVNGGKPNFNFGMHVNAEFAQPLSGLVAGNPMRFEFNGDDDMWVFIDGYLVLDIGGIHDAQSGYIDFATGEVKTFDVYNSTAHPKVTSLYDIYTAIIRQDVEADTSIRERYKDAEIQKRLDEIFEKNSSDKYVFKDYTSHSFDMFYMERGQGASNLKMSFNLPTVDPGDINIKKTVNGIDHDKDFEFQLYLECEEVSESELNSRTTGNPSYQKYIQENGRTYQLQTNRGYVKTPRAGEDKNEVTDATTGIFKLKNGEQASFKEIDISTFYILREVNVNDGVFEFENVKINNEDGSHKIVDDDGNEDPEGNIVQVSPFYIGQKNKLEINVTNKFNGQDLRIKKEFKAGETISNPDQLFYFKLLQGADKTVFSGEYDVTPATGDAFTRNTGQNNGYIALKVGETATVSGYKVGVAYEVLECGYEGNIVDAGFVGDKVFGVPLYTYANEAKVIVDESKTSTRNLVTVTNCNYIPGPGSIVVQKNIDENTAHHGDAIFTFEVTRKKGEDVDSNFKRVVHIRLSDIIKVGYVRIDDLEVGYTYMVKELDTIRYKVTGNSVQIGKKPLEEGQVQVFLYANTLNYNYYYSHADMKINNFSVEDGEITFEGGEDKIQEDSAYRLQ
ncbi:fibro-slime domain-containing protein [Lachnospiraceae bacterium PF1-21]